MSDKASWTRENEQNKTMLIIDDNEQFLEQTCRYFGNWLRVEHARDGLSGLVQTMRLEPDIILLNYRAAKVDCAELCRRIRDIDGALLFVLADEEMSDEQRIACFEAGADDVLRQSCSSKELMLRIQVFMRRSEKIAVRPDTGSTLQFGPLRMDNSSYLAYIYDKDLVLTRKEFTILWVLASNAGQIVSRHELLRRVWNYYPMDDDRIIDTHLNRLRKKLQHHSEQIRIKTAWGIGYRLEPIDLSAMNSNHA